MLTSLDQVMFFGIEEFCCRTGEVAPFSTLSQTRPLAPKSWRYRKPVQDLPAAFFRHAADVDPFDYTALAKGGAEGLEFALRKDAAEVAQFEFETQVRLIRAVAFHRLFPGQARERGFQCNAMHVLHHRRQQFLDDINDIILIDETHFEIDLGEFRLAVGTQVFITKTASDLEVALDAADHQQLLVLLGCLRQCIKAARIHTTGHQIVPCALRRTLA